MASEKIIVLTNDSFEDEVIKSEVPVLVDFWAEWCGPCRMVGPIIDEIAEEYEGRAKICKVNVDDQSELAIKYKVMTIPNIVTFKDGEIADQVSGANTKDFFTALLDKLMPETTE